MLCKRRKDKGGGKVKKQKSNTNRRDGRQGKEELEKVLEIGTEKFHPYKKLLHLFFVRAERKDPMKMQC